ATRTYREYRNAVRTYYREHYPVTSEALSNPYLNPGNGSVSALTHEPRVSVAVLESMLEPFVHRQSLTILLHHIPVAAELTRPDRIDAIMTKDVRTGDRASIAAKYFIDATETGELLPVTKTEFVTGAESRAQTGELHAAPEPQPDNVQSFTCCFALDYLEGEDHTIEKPRDFTFWRDYVPNLTPLWTGKLLSWTCPNPQTLAPRELFFDPRPKAPARPGLNLWVYRRILDPVNFAPGRYRSAITLVNWPQNDFWLGDLLQANQDERRKLIDRAKQLSLSWLYWMQTEAPRGDGKVGWKGLRLRRDVVGTTDGLAKAPYIRESRRIEAEFTVLEQHVGAAARKEMFPNVAEPEAEQFPDSVGVGYYRLDLHPSTGGNNYIDIASLRFQIPLGALIPKSMENLLAGSKNIGVTHITNGCYRLHPVEWNVGEAAGAVAAQAIKTGRSPRAIRNSPGKLRDLHQSLVEQGFELSWPADG
ncbi:MAG: FAD-dependent oxidoreductase, partial [Bryobacteraceae bacterium]